MQFMVMRRSDEATEAGRLPAPAVFEDVGYFHEKLAEAGGVGLALGLRPSSRAVRLKLWPGGESVTDGPFAETKELIAGFWLIEVSSKQEAIEWMRRCPNPYGEGRGDIEIRQLFEAEDFGAELTPELREQEERRREQLAAR